MTDGEARATSPGDAAREAIAEVERGLKDGFASFSSLPNAVCHETRELFLVATSLPISFCNGVVGGHFSPERTDEQIDGVMSLFRERSVPFRWWITPNTEPPDLGARLVGRGFRPRGGPSPGMAADLATLSQQRDGAADVLIERIEDLPSLKRFVSTLEQGFGSVLGGAEHWVTMYQGFLRNDASPWQHFVGLVDGLPVATATVMLGSEGVAGIYHVVTLAPWRRRGIGQAVTRRAMQDAKEKGYRLAVLQSTAMAEPMYESLGFRTVCRVQMFASP